MINSLSFAVSLGIAVIGLASPANAFVPLEGSASAAARVQSTQSNAPAPAAKDAAKKYCLTMEAATGSRMVTRECKTRAEWEMLGYELSGKE